MYDIILLYEMHRKEVPHSFGYLYLYQADAKKPHNQTPNVGGTSNSKRGQACLFSMLHGHGLFFHVRKVKDSIILIIGVPWFLSTIIDVGCWLTIELIQ